MRVKNFIKAGAILFVGSFATKFLGYIYIIPLRKIEPKIEAMMAYLLVPYAFLILFSVLGMRGSINYKVAEESGDNKKIKSFLFTGLVIVLLSSLLFALVQFFFAKTMLRLNSVYPNYEYYDILLRGTQMLSAALLFAPAGFVLIGFFAGMGDYKVITITNVIQQLCFILLIFLGTAFVVRNSYDRGYLIYVLAISTVLSVIVGFSILIVNLLLRKRFKEIVRAELSVKPEGFKFLLLLSGTFLITSIYITALNRIDLLFMGWGLEKFGLGVELIEKYIGRYFTSSGKLIVVAVALSDAFSMALIRHIKVLDKEQKPIQFNTIMNLTILCGLTMTLFYFFEGKQIYSFLYGYDKEGIQVLKAQSILVFIHVIRNILVTYTVTMGHKRVVVTSALIVIIAKIPLSIILMSLLGIQGAVLSTVIPAVLSIIYIIYKMKDQLIINKKIVLQKIYYVIITGVPFAFIMAFIHFSPVKSNFITLLVSLGIYLAIMGPLFLYLRNRKPGKYKK